jgi:hypothetical protein
MPSARKRVPGEALVLSAPISAALAGTGIVTPHAAAATASAMEIRAIVAFGPNMEMPL